MRRVRISCILILPALLLLSSCGLLSSRDATPTSSGSIGSRNGHQHLYRTDLDGQGETEIVKEAVDTFVVEGDRIFYRNSGDSCLYAVTIDGASKIRLTQTAISARFRVQDGYVYFTGASGNGLSRVGIDGNGLSSLAPDSSSEFRFSDGLIYYLNSTLNGIFRMKPDGTENAKVADKGASGSQIVSFLIVNDQVVYSVGGLEAGDEALYRTQGPGEAPELMMEKTPIVLLEAMDGWIYYFGYGDPYGFCRMKADGTEAKTIAANTPKMQDQGPFTDLVFRPDRIYYRGFENVIYHIAPDGSGQAALGDANGWDLTVTDDWVFYVNATDLYRVKKDGSEAKRLFRGTTLEYQVAGDFVFFVSL